MIRQIRLEEVMKRSKRLGSLTKKREFGPHALPISGWFPKETLGASWHWQVGINPQQVSATAIYGHHGTPGQGSACFAQGMSFIHTSTPVEFIKYSRKRVR